jgi:hypothetical protein
VDYDDTKLLVVNHKQNRLILESVTNYCRKVVPIEIVLNLLYCNFSIDNVDDTLYGFQSLAEFKLENSKTCGTFTNSIFFCYKFSREKQPYDGILW